MSKRILMLVIILMPIIGKCQITPRIQGDWYRGLLVTQKGDTLDGFIDFQSKNHELRFHNDRLVRVFHTSQVKSFQYFDEFLNMQRYFASYNISQHNLREKRLYEKLVFGKYQILRRVNKESDFPNERDGIHYYLNFSTFYLWDGQKITRIRNFTKQFETLFAKHQINLKNLIKENNWTTYKVSDLIKIVSRLNIKTR